MAIYREEVFGPGALPGRVDSLEQAIPPDQQKAPTAAAPRSSPAPAPRHRTFQHHIEVGQVGINIPIPVPCRSSPSPVGRARSTATCAYGKRGVRYRDQDRDRAWFDATTAWPGQLLDPDALKGRRTDGDIAFLGLGNMGGPMAANLLRPATG